MGLWSADEVCVYSAGIYSSDPYPCAKSAPHGKYTDLFACSNGYAHSGYSADVTDASTVCGCYDWPGLPSVEACRNSNPDWEQVAFPMTKVTTA